MADRSIDLEITATDSASDVIGDVADAVDSLPEDASIELDADTSDAETRLERLERELDDLTDDDSRELRLQFRAETLQREIRTALRDLEKLEEPIEIEARSRDLETAQQELRDVAELAGRKYEVDIDADPKRTARRAAGDIDSMRERGEGLQSAVPALRGFTDELGGAAGKAGIASQAVADLGDFSLILGERFGISEGATAKLGTALGALGLGGVIVGGAIAGFQILQSEQRKVAENTREAANALADQADEITGVTDRIEELARTDPILQAIFGDADDEQIRKVTEALGEAGLTVDDLGPTLRGLSDDAEGFIGQLLAGRPGIGEWADEIAAAVAESDNWDTSITMLGTGIEQLLQKAGVPQEVIDTYRPVIEGLEELQDQVDDTDLSEVFTGGLASLKATEEGLAAVTQATDELGSGARDVDIYARALQILDDASDDAASSAGDNAEAQRDVAGPIADAGRAAEAAAAFHRELAEAQLADAEAALEAAGARRTVADRTQEVAENTDRWNETLFAQTAAIGEAEEGTIAYRDAQRDTVDAAVALADSVKAQNEAAAEAEGRTLAASDGTSAWNASMVGAAQQASGPLRQAIIDYIAQVNGIPPEKVSEILADTNYATVEEAAGALDGVSVTRQAQIDAEANTYQAENDINYAARTRQAFIDIVARGGSILPGLPFAVNGRRAAPASLGAPIPTAARSAGGDRLFLSSPAEAAELAGAGGSVTVNNVRVTLPQTASGRDVVREIERWQRVNGRRR